MNGRLKLKGRVFTHLIYPCIMSVVLFVVGIWITVIDSDAGSIILSLAIVYLIFTIVMYVVNQKLVMQELIKFAVDYAQVQKELLDDMVIPYGLIDRQGNILWQDGEMSHLLRREYWKRVPEVFKEITDEHLELGDEIKEMHINFKDHFYRVQLKRVDTDKAFNNTEILDIENQEYVIAMYMFDETRIRKIALPDSKVWESDFSAHRGSAATGLMREPMPWMRISITSPGWTGLTPEGVPVKITSPGSRVRA